MFCNFGNHDDNSYMQEDLDQILNIREISNVLLNKSCCNIRYCTAFTYFFDSEQDHLRYLCINTGKRNLSEEEFSFVVNALFSAPENYNLIVMGHIWVEWNGKSHIPNKETQLLFDLFNAYNERKKITGYDFKDVKNTILMIWGGGIYIMIGFCILIVEFLLLQPIQMLGKKHVAKM